VLRHNAIAPMKVGRKTRLVAVSWKLP
jgi:hypothetical protein